jgi:DNA topoisomerase-2
MVVVMWSPTVPLLTTVGSIEQVTQPMWVVDLATKKLVSRDVTIVPGLFKIFDEILVNAADNKQRDPRMNKLAVNIDQEANTISVWNNGAGIPVVMHGEHKIYVPELIFGHLLTSSNYDDDEKKGKLACLGRDLVAACDGGV